MGLKLPPPPPAPLVNPADSFSSPAVQQWLSNLAQVLAPALTSVPPVAAADIMTALAASFLDVGGWIRSTGGIEPTSGAGLAMWYSGGVCNLKAEDVDAAVLKALLVQGLSLTFASNGGDISFSASGTGKQVLLPSNTSISSSSWVFPVLGNSWANLGSPFATAAYYKDAVGIVHLRGVVGSGTVGVTIFTLPAGYQPIATILLAVVSNDLFGEVRIDSSGNVSLSVGSNASVSLDGISFRAA